MKTSDNRKAAFLVLAAISLSFIGLAGPAAGAQTLDITGLRISPNPGYACDNTTISFNVTNNLGSMVDFVEVHVDAKSSVSGMSWQSNITLFANGATSFQSFTWTYPAEGTYDVSITVFGAGQIAQKSGVYTVLPCKAHVYIGTVTIVKSVQAPGDSATVKVDVENDGHAPAYNTTVAVQATGPHPDATRYFLGSTVIPVIAENGAGHPDFIWAPLPMPGVYAVTVMTIDETGVMMSKEVSLVVDLQPQPNTVHITGISLDPYPPMQGQESTVTAGLMFTGNWTGVPVTVMAYADGPSSYKLYNVTLKEVMVSGLVAVNFSWPAAIEPGQYNLTVTAQFNPREYTISRISVTQMAKQKQWSPANFRLELKGLRMSPYPALPGQNSTVTVEIANTGDADAPPAKLTVTAEGPAFYHLGTRTTPSTSFGTMVRMEFNWTQPVVPGEYIVRAFLEDIGGNQSDLKRTFVLPHILESSGSVVNGTTVFNYYYYDGAPNGTTDHNVTVTVKETGESAAAGLSMSNPAVAGATGVAVGGAISAISMLIYAYASKKGYDYYKVKNDMSATGAQTNPIYEDKGGAGQNPMYKDKGMAGENPLYIHERMVHGIHNAPESNPPPAASASPPPGGASDGSTNQWPSMVRESPTLPSKGQTSLRESPTKASLGRTSATESPTPPSTGPTEAKSKVAAVGRVETPLGLQGTRESPTLASPGVVAPRDAASGLATGRRQYVPHGVTDADGDAASDARMAINEKGLPGKKKPSTQRLAGDGTEPVDDDSDDDGVPEIQGMAINEKGLPGDKKPKKTSSQARTAGGEPLDPDSDDDGLSDTDERKGWDGTVKGSTKADEAPEGTQSVKPISGVGIVVKSNSGSSSSGERKGWDGTVKGVTSDAGATGREAAHPVISNVRESPTKASGLRESPTRATIASTRDSVSSVAQTAGSGGDGMPTESPSLDQSRKGWDGTIKGVTTDESARGREAAHPVISKLRESPTRASGLRESPTLPSADQTAVRESPTKASTGQTSIRESPTRSDYAIKEQGVKSSQAAPPAGDLDGDGSPDLAMKEEGGRHTPFQNKAQEAQDHNSTRSNKTSSIAAPDGGEGTGSGGTGPDGEHSVTDKDGKKNYVGHVTLIKQ